LVALLFYHKNKSYFVFLWGAKEKTLKAKIASDIAPPPPQQNTAHQRAKK
jgi:hypothetical protein